MSKPRKTGDLATWPNAESRDISHQPKNPPALHVLVVDDEPLIRWSVAETLEQAGHRVVEAADAASAVRAVALEDSFDVVVLDYRLPDSNDLNLLRTIRNQSPRSAVIMMTAFGAADIAAGALGLGVHCVVPKPFEVDDMAALVVEAHRGGIASVDSYDGSLGRRT